MTRHEQSGADSPDTAGVEHSSDGVSASMHDPRFVRLLVDASPDIRRERVEELRRAIQIGAYDLNPAAVAERMILNLTRRRD